MVVEGKRIWGLPDVQEHGPQPSQEESAVNEFRKLSCAVITAIALGAGFAATTAEAAGGSSGVSSLKTSLSPAERGALTHAFVKKWGVYVQQVYGLDVRSWANRMVPTFVSSDPVNFQRALQRSTFEGAMATLDGAGHKLSDDKVIDVLAASDTLIGPYALGDLNKDLVFTAVEPCRIVDTRSTTAGAIAANTNRAFYVWGFPDFTSQGGSTTDCGGLSAQSPQAVVVNLTVVGPASAGYATMFPATSTLPLAASLLYKAGDVLSNGVTVKLGLGATGVGFADFRIYTVSTAHYVVDIVGYYDAPYATALDCVLPPAQAVSLPAGFNGYMHTTSVCSAGYTAVSPYCYNSSTSVYSNGSGGIGAGPDKRAWCGWVNPAATAQSVFQSATCCRVPGR